jgi:hypothetical protein
LDEFIKEKDKHLINEVKEGDYDHLVSMMAHLGAVREKINTYDNMFEPIKQKIELLKNYGQEVPDEVYDKLQVRTIFIIFSLSLSPSLSLSLSFSLFYIIRTIFLLKRFCQRNGQTRKN